MGASVSADDTDDTDDTTELQNYRWAVGRDWCRRQKRVALFSGIVETRSRVLNAQTEGGLVRIQMARPTEFKDLKIGDSVCVNGICLTVERFDDVEMTFALGAETLRITGWTADGLRDRDLNVEGSLRFGDRIHGHLVAGHVDNVGTVLKFQDQGGSVDVDIKAPSAMLPFIWKKGSWAVNGVSLTINEVQGDVVSMCLIPETLKRTTLGDLKAGVQVNLEADLMARGLVHYLAHSKERPS